MSNHVANLKACLEAGDPGSIMLQDLEYVIREYEYADAQCAKQAEEIVALKAAMAAQSASIEAGAATIAELRDELQAMQVQNEHNTALQEKVRELTAQKAAAEQACDALRKEVAAVRQALEEAREFIAGE